LKNEYRNVSVYPPLSKRDDDDDDDNLDEPNSRLVRIKDGKCLISFD